MGLVKKAAVDTPAEGDPGPGDIATAIRQAVAAEIERQRLEKQEAEARGDAPPPDGD